MVWFKQCKKCRGDLYLESDRYGAYVACVQCGAIDREVPNPSRVPVRVAVAEKELRDEAPAAARRLRVG